MSIHQLQIAFDAVQDRLVLRVATTANEEIRAHLTRRFVREIWPHLMRVLNGHLGGAMPSSGVLQPTRPARTTAPSASPSRTTSSPARWAARRCWWPNARSRRQARAVAASYCASPANAAWCWTSTRTSPRSSVRCCAQRSRWPTGTSRSTMMPHGRGRRARRHAPEGPPLAAALGRTGRCTRIQPATPAIGADGTPWSEQYGDVYHSHDGGLGQAQHVFLAGNGLPERWQGRARFVIVETGFGLGLNFLATWAAWRGDATRSARLHFISFEKHPSARMTCASCTRAGRISPNSQVICWHAGRRSHPACIGCISTTSRCA